MSQFIYLIALGSNRCHGRYGPPRRIIGAALSALERAGLVVLAVSPIMDSTPLGPSSRRYANGTALVETARNPTALLAQLKAIEARFGRRRGRRWGARVLDLDIILWSGGIWATSDLTIPHREFRKRAFVLDPASAIAPDWRDPLTGRTLAQLACKKRRKTPVDRDTRAP